MADEKHLARLEADNLPAQFAADGSARAGDEHDLIFQVRSDQRGVELDWLALEQIIQPHVANARRRHVTHEQILQVRNNLDGRRLAAARLGPAACRKNLFDQTWLTRSGGNDNVRNASGLDEAFEIIGRAY